MAFLGVPGPPFFLFMFLITIPMMTKSAMNDADALLRIKQSFNNPMYLDSWKLGTRHCEWVGLVCGNGIVTTLRLKSLNLSGNIDVFALSQLQGLRVLNIANNSFSGTIPEFNKLGALKAIYLSMNQFSGEIPANYFTKMASLKKIWLDNNNFSGSIPSSLTQLPRLRELHLHNNNFSGVIPSVGQQTLESFNISNNKLTGDIPSSLSRFDVGSFEGNPGLCGSKMGRLCYSVVPTPPPPLKPHHESLKIAYVLMSVTAFIFASMIIAIYVLVQKRKKEVDHKRKFDGSFGLISSQKEHDSDPKDLEND